VSYTHALDRYSAKSHVVEVMPPRRSNRSATGSVKAVANAAQQVVTGAVLDGTQTPVMPARQKRYRTKDVVGVTGSGSPLAHRSVPKRAPKRVRLVTPSPKRQQIRPQGPFPNVDATRRPNSTAEERIGVLRQRLNLLDNGSSTSDGSDIEVTGSKEIPGRGGNGEGGELDAPPSSPPAMEDYAIVIFTKIFLNRKLKSTPALLERTRLSVDLSEVEVMISSIVEALVAPIEPTSVSVIANIKDPKGRTSREQLVMDDFAFDTQEKVLLACDQQKRYKGSSLSVIIEYKIELDLKAQQLAIEQAAKAAVPPIANGNEASDEVPPNATPSTRATRTRILTENTMIRMDAARASGNAEATLRSRWFCKEQSCYNEHGLCYRTSPADDAVHYPISGPQLKAWSNQITAGNTTLEDPPKSIFEQIVSAGASSSGVRRQVDGRRQRKNDVSSMFDQLLDTQKAFAEDVVEMRHLKLKERHMNRLDRMVDNLEERDDREAELEKNQMPRRPLAGPPNARQAAVAFSAYRSVQDTQQSSLQAALSSPIQLLNGERSDYDIIEAFFRWMSDRISNPAIRIEWDDANKAVLESMWTVDDLKAMEKEESPQSKEAAEKLLPRALARSFRRHLRDFRIHQKRLLADMEAEGSRVVQSDVFGSR
jgi:hypothetical protein